MAVEVHPATSDRWQDVVAVFGRRGRDASWCWCRLFLSTPGKQPRRSSEMVSNRDALRDEIESAEVPRGLIAYVEGCPVGWTRIGPRSQLPGVRGNRALARVLTDHPDVWWVTCFAVESRARRSGVGSIPAPEPCSNLRRSSKLPIPRPPDPS